VYLRVDLLVSDRATTLFAVLFGTGSWIQLQRFPARKADFCQPSVLAVPSALVHRSHPNKRRARTS